MPGMNRSSLPFSTGKAECQTHSPNQWNRWLRNWRGACNQLSRSRRNVRFDTVR
jgi:hypothetical protein